LLASFAASLALLTFGSGPGVSDAKVNLSLGPVTVQPVELIKVLLVLFLAGYFADRWEFLRALKEPAGRLPRFLRAFNLPRLQYAAPVLAGVALATVFFFLQKDLGPALVFTGVFLSLYAVARARAAGLILGCVLLILAFLCGYYLGTPQTVAARVSMWLAPWDNFLRSGGDHVAHSLWGFASGGFFGAGLGLGEPQATPAVHSDLILAAIAEELGFVGVLAIYLLYALLIARALQVALRASGHYSLFLALGFTLLLGLQVALISGGVLGLSPLSGVVTPFLNYGRSSALANFAILGILASLSARSGGLRNEEFRRPLLWVGRVFGVIGALVLIQAFRLQVLQADEVLVRSAIVRQADGKRRPSYNPRILEASRLIPRGSIMDRNGIPLAASSLEVLEQYRQEYERIGVNIDPVVRSGARRMYPFGAGTFHLLGDLRSRTNWGAPNTSFVERDSNPRLQGYDDYAIVARVENTPGGERHSVLKRDYRELIPLVRHRWRPEHGDVRALLERERDLRLTLDVRLQKRALELLEKHVRLARRRRGAAIVIDVASGDILASATYPFAGAGELMNRVPPPDEVVSPGPDESLLDRPRYGLYPPGSSFKLVTAAAALQKSPDASSRIYECKPLSGGRIGNHVRGWGQPVRDDVLDRTPHGAVDMGMGLTVSCNAYFAQLGTYLVGPEALLRAAELYGIRVASPNTAAQLKDALPQAAYGQGQVVASPLQMARVSAGIAGDGRLPPARIVFDAKPATPEPALAAGNARRIAEYMRRVVTQGTGRILQSWSVPIAGKTGTAELRNQPSHAWFVGFAPYGNAKRKIAFAVIIENGRYGAQVAAPLAGDLVVAAASLGLIDRE
jgi:cell division protein FtsW (lipid II flippase)